MVDVADEVNDDEFLLVSFITCGTHTPNFLILPVECKCRTVVDIVMVPMVPGLIDVDDHVLTTFSVSDGFLTLENRSCRNEKTIFVV